MDLVEITTKLDVAYSGCSRDWRRQEGDGRGAAVRLQTGVACWELWKTEPTEELILKEEYTHSDLKQFAGGMRAQTSFFQTFRIKTWI